MKVQQTPVQSQILKNPESRRSFTEAFKRQAVELMESGRAVAQLARELEVSAFSLYEWKRKYGTPVDAAASAPGNLGALQDENLALKAEVLRLRQREEILGSTKNSDNFVP